MFVQSEIAVSSPETETKLKVVYNIVLEQDQYGGGGGRQSVFSGPPVTSPGIQCALQSPRVSWASPPPPQ